MRIVCAGAGFVSIDAAPYIKKQLPEAKVTMINKDNRHSVLPHVPELLSGQVSLDAISLDLESYCKARNVEFIQGRITHIDRQKKIVYAGEIEIPYDYLLLDLGSEPETEAIPGVDKALSRAGPIGMLEIRQHVVTQFMKLRASNAPEHRAFVVAGASVSGIETVTAMHELIKELCEKHLIFPHEIVLILVEQETTEYPIGKRALRHIKGILEEKDIEYYPGKITRFTSQGVELEDFMIETETLVWCGKKRANKLIRTLQLSIDSYGAVLVNEYLQTEDPHIFAAGDNASIPQAKHKDIPRTAFMAYDEEKAVADNIIAAVREKRMEQYTPRSPIPVIITTGPKTALLITKLYRMHGKLPYKLKNWVSEKYAQRIHKT